jgi:hypothetical protein
MSVFETTSLTFGAAIAKQILNSWLGDNAAGLSGEPVDLLQGRAENTLAPREATRRIEKIGNQVAEMLRPVFEAERMPQEICNETVEISSELSSFERHFSETSLQSQDQVLDLVEKIF